jgi:TadE-like protein
VSLSTTVHRKSYSARVLLAASQFDGDAQREHPGSDALRELGVIEECDALRSRRGRGARGQSLVEFTLIVPILMIILLGAVDFGRVMQGRVTAEAATRAGASWGAGILANATQGLSPVYYLFPKNPRDECAYGPTCNIEARACAEAAGFPGYSGGPALTGGGANPVTYHDCANNYAASTNSVAGVCSPSATQSNPFLAVKWWHANGIQFTPTATLQATVGDTIEVDGTFCFVTLVPWPGIPSRITFSTSARYTVQP